MPCNVVCNLKRTCAHNLNYRCQITPRLRAVWSEEFDAIAKEWEHDIENIELDFESKEQVKYAMLVCMSFEEKPSKPPIRKEWSGAPEKITDKPPSHL